MPFTPSMAERRAKEVTDILVEAENQVMQRVRNAVAKNVQPSRTDLDKLADLQRLRRDITRDMAAARQGSIQALERLTSQAYELGADAAASDIRALGITPRLIQTNVATVSAFANEAATNIAASHLRILRQVEDTYREAVGLGIQGAIAGGETRQKSVQRILDDFADRGITGFVDKAGRNWDLFSYTDMATRTALGRAAVQGHIDTLRRNDQNLVIVSDSPEECPLCRPYEGRVFALEGETDDYPNVNDAISGGLFHPRCTHRLGIYIEGVTKPMHDTANPQGYEERQRQRRLERNVRRWKRREAVAMTPQERAYATRHRKAAQRRVREFTRDTGRRRDYWREQGPRIADVDVPETGAVRLSERLTNLDELTGDAGRVVNKVVGDIEAIHRMPNDAPSVHVDVVDNLDGNALGMYRQTAGGKPVDVRVRSDGGHLEMTTAHEIGHYVDHVDIDGDILAYASEKADSEAVYAWRKAVQESKAFQHLREVQANPEDYLPEVPEGTPPEAADRWRKRVIAAINKQTEYMLRPRELWARSYAQYIGRRSGYRIEGTLDTATNDAMRITPGQWDDDDFTAIDAAISDILDSAGLTDGN